TREHEAGAAAHLEETPRAGKIAAERPDDQPVTGAEPEIARLQLGQRREVRRVVSLRRVRQLRRERGDSSLHPRLEAAARAAPYCTLESGAAVEAQPQPWLPTTIPTQIRARPASLVTLSGSWNSQAEHKTTSTNARLTKG